MAPKRKGSAGGLKFSWNNDLMRKFVEICVEWQKANCTVQPFRWAEIAYQFQHTTGKVATKETMKHKFDHLKKLWKDWTSLKYGETGLGWDAATGKITADPEWWDKKIKEKPKYNKFRNKSIPLDVEALWDELFGSIVASGQHCIAPTMEGYVPPAPPVDDTDFPDDDDCASDDGLEGLLNIDLDSPDPDILREVLRKVSEPAGASGSRGPKRSVSGKSGTDAKSRKRQSAGSTLFNQHLAAVEDTSQKILALYEQDVASSAMPPPSCTKSLDDAMVVIEQMVLGGLMLDGSPLWCFSVDEMRNLESRELFFSIPRNMSRKSWLEWRFQKQ